MYISVPSLSSAYLQNISLEVVANFFSIPTERDEELSPGIYIAKPVRIYLLQGIYLLGQEYSSGHLC